VALITRKDDQLATIQKRLQIDRAQAKPLLAYYQRAQLLYRVDGMGASTAVFERVKELVHAQGWVAARRRVAPARA
jgi:adenylate kinase family enzyme